MLSKQDFSELVNEIVSQGYNEATAAEYAALIGDTPTVDEEGNVLVIKGDVVLARLKPLKCFGE